MEGSQALIALGLLFGGAATFGGISAVMRWREFREFGTYRRVFTVGPIVWNRVPPSEPVAPGIERAAFLTDVGLAMAGLLTGGGILASRFLG